MGENELTTVNLEYLRWAGKTIKEYKADADRRRELMKKQDKKIKVCQFCYRHLKWSKDIQRMVGHADDCEWGQELADAR